MARAGALIFLLGLVVATFCVSEVAAGRQLIDLGLVDLDLDLDINLKLSVNNEGTRAVVVKLLDDVKDKVEDVKAKVLEVKKDAVAVLGPVEVELSVAKLLDLEVEVLGDDGQLVKAVVKVDLSKVEALVSGVVEVVLRVVEDVAAKVVKVVRGNEVLVTIDVSVN
ncbi:hypothetical protein M758_1G201500 [Ceratodon purpureus]|uniref:Uncharacterized protein n=1 Tax=Ceratodon purpureus TaxID=3225 RepID=A0A8T0JA79_CERPU|nr:hypothetical protein KC19_1G219400 [Ceratodon purpureus]KAG0630748.1 hypothetical protein M758_1G201500 [Ceratodon purpureus]